MPIDIPLTGRVLTAEVSGPGDPNRPRRPGSIRRTSSLNMDWPNGWDSSARVRARARDLLTLADTTKTIADDVLVATVAEGRVYESLFTFPDRPALQAVVGLTRPGNSRNAVSALVPEEQEAGTPLFLLLDDLPAIALISGQVKSEWIPTAQALAQRGDRPIRRVIGICSGYTPGSSALDPDGSVRMIQQVQAIGPLTTEADPQAWHTLQAETSEPEMRRVRRIDVWKDDVLHIDSFFQDSCTTAGGVRVAVHEYALEATADLETGVLLTVSAQPHVLPFDSCPAAASNVDRMIGIPLNEFRSAVLKQLPGTLGCTHLSDALRALAEVPSMARLTA
ncbi:MAG: DUF2889 domain-containing protein [Actinomycetota bacterium]|nr:DUF2889 domain-containing protein [Actinomycetota bacterium]MDP2288015.1 DUF2889 domain-containing protein [Actinomycetota bacterium]